MYCKPLSFKPVACKPPHGRHSAPCRRLLWHGTLCLMMALAWPAAHANGQGINTLPAPQTQQTPQAAWRSHTQNFKDMVLATCLAQAYAQDPKASVDAGSSVSALRDWTYFDMEQSPDRIQALVKQYLARNYHNPLAEAEVPGLQFDTLKCLDLYHSQALKNLAKQMVIDPNRRPNPKHRPKETQGKP